MLSTVEPCETSQARGGSFWDQNDPGPSQEGKIEDQPIECSHACSKRMMTSSGSDRDVCLTASGLPLIWRQTLDAKRKTWASRRLLHADLPWDRHRIRSSVHRQSKAPPRFANLWRVCMESDKAEAGAKGDDTPRIRRLPESVVNRIAAGEVVVRPSAALKELLENSLDAGATSITITARQGGLKLLQVSDDGNGIPREDLALLCQRFATSKLRTYEDLAGVSTFGFRGEALASISHVSRLSVLTKTKDSDVAYKATYLDGVLRSDPEPTAGCEGTAMIIEDMFYNLTPRKNALKSPSDEYRAIVEVVSRYALRYPKVAFICRRSPTGNSSRVVAASDVRTELCSSVKDNIRAGFGSSVANELLSFDIDIAQATATASAYVSSANFSMKKAVFILFINGRLVDCQPFRRGVLAAYACFLPKSGHPFVYIDLRMNQEDIDVNVHPTKKEVRFLNEEVIVEAVVELLIEKLKTTETSRTFLAQSIIAADGSGLRAELPSAYDAPSEPNQSQSVEKDRFVAGEVDGATQDIETVDELTGQADAHSDDELPDRPDSPNELRASPEAEINDVEDVNGAAFVPSSAKTSRTQNARVSEDLVVRPSSKSRNVHAKNKVRTGSSAPVGLYDVYLSRNNESSLALGIQTWRKRRPDALPLLTSVQTMLNESQHNAHRGLSQVLKEHIYVGVASDKFVLLQHSTKLMLAEIDPILVELMYQQTLTRFADQNTFCLDPPAPVTKLLEGYVETLDESGMRTNVKTCTTILLEKASMLSEYYGISFQGQGADDVEIKTLPLLLPDVMPDMRYFGSFLYHLAADVNWSEEISCLEGISVAIADWYGKHWIPAPSADSEVKSSGDENRGENVDDIAAAPTSALKKSPDSETERREWMLRHILFASLRKDFYPPQRFFTQKVIREITSTARLYKVFERC